MASELTVGGITTTGNVGIGCTAESALQVQGTFVGSGVPTAAGLHAGMSGNHCLVQLVANGSNGSPYIDFSNVPEDVDFRIIEAGDGSKLTIQPYGVAGLEMSTAGLCTFGNGIAFQSATTGSGTGTGYTLDSYETGTWTPDLLLGGSNTGITFSTRAGTYTKTGNVVNYWFSFALTSKGSQTGRMTIDDLPFTNNAEGTGAGNFNYVRNVAGTNWEKSFHLTLGGGDDLLYARYINGTDYEVLADTDITDTTIMYGGGSYITTD
tara:strand:+ start:2567 stop:3361 length:795 start_codon:yes stop_codon:yes gene_type:complete